MLYPKNVPNIERILRIGLGIVLVVIAVTGGLSGLAVGGLFFTAGFVVITGFIGWCPACALIGRKIKHKATTQ